jgi:hypothetical protein
VQVFQGALVQASDFSSRWDRNRLVHAGMRLRIIQIADRGVPGKECLYLAVDTPVDLNFYAVFDTVRIGVGLISQSSRHTYWFQHQAVSAGDDVILYTGPGMNSFAKREDGRAIYSFYWGLDSTLWSEPSSCAVLLEVNQWQTSPNLEARIQGI